MLKGQSEGKKIFTSKWNTHNQKIHNQKLKKIKSQINSGSPLSYDFLKHNQKKQKILQERFSEIERENRIWLEKVSGILNTNKLGSKPLGRRKSLNSQNRKSLNSQERTRKNHLIRVENQEILKRIQEKQPNYSVYQWKEERKRTEKQLKRICKFPYSLGISGDDLFRKSSDFKSKNNFSSRKVIKLTNSISISEKTNARSTKLQNFTMFKKGVSLGDKYFIIEVQQKNENIIILAYDIESPDSYSLKFSKTEVLKIMGAEENYQKIVNMLSFKDGELVLLDNREAFQKKSLNMNLKVRKNKITPNFKQIEKKNANSGEKVLEKNEGFITDKKDASLNLGRINNEQKFDNQYEKDHSFEYDNQDLKTNENVEDEKYRIKAFLENYENEEKHKNLDFDDFVEKYDIFTGNYEAINLKEINEKKIKIPLEKVFPLKNKADECSKFYEKIYRNNGENIENNHMSKTNFAQMEFNNIAINEENATIKEKDRKIKSDTSEYNANMYVKQISQNGLRTDEKNLMDLDESLSGDSFIEVNDYSNQANKTYFVLEESYNKKEVSLSDEEYASEGENDSDDLLNQDKLSMENFKTSNLSHQNAKKKISDDGLNNCYQQFYDDKILNEESIDFHMNQVNLGEDYASSDENSNIYTKSIGLNHKTFDKKNKSIGGNQDSIEENQELIEENEESIGENEESIERNEDSIEENEISNEKIEYSNEENEDSNEENQKSIEDNDLIYEEDINSFQNSKVKHLIKENLSASESSKALIEQNKSFELKNRNQEKIPQAFTEEFDEENQDLVDDFQDYFENYDKSEIMPRIIEESAEYLSKSDFQSIRLPSNPDRIHEKGQNGEELLKKTLENFLNDMYNDSLTDFQVKSEDFTLSNNCNQGNTIFNKPSSQNIL